VVGCQFDVLTGNTDPTAATTNRELKAKTKYDWKQTTEP